MIEAKAIIKLMTLSVLFFYTFLLCISFTIIKGYAYASLNKIIREGEEKENNYFVAGKLKIIAILKTYRGMSFYFAKKSERMCF
ncbi:hypothetical protein [uncultured Eubacterium sp.]|uniref:hypothetical protein n=1 Tax=uncultured Eubacterium sp. TaxID=165185 RepID=UPI0026746102|nr:hypothetical protein [uncultured Eubacterium sp.]